jgi:hypothetical protein
MVNSSYAYSLSQAEQGWTWRVYDEAGEIVRAGQRKTQHSAEVAVKRAINEACRSFVSASGSRA